MKKNKESLFGTRTEIFLGVTLLLGFLLPHTNNIFMLVNPILCVCFLLLNRNNFCIYGLAPIIAIVISMLINAAGAATGKSMLTAISIILCLVAFPMVNGTKIKNVYIFLCFGVIFLSQVAYMFQWGFVTSFIDVAYPINWGEDFIIKTNENVTLDNYMDFRLGGLYRNPNHCSKYVSFLLAIFLVNNEKESIKKQLWFAALCYICVLLTGSRTGFVVCSILVVLSLMRNQKAKYSVKMVVAIIVATFILYMMLSGSGLRGMAIDQGLNDSAGAKFRLVLRYLSDETSFIYYMFGHLDLSLFESPYTYNLDCEYGYVIYCFGFVGLIAFAYNLIQMYRHVEKPKRVFFVVLLWMISSSIFMAYRTVFVFMLLLSTIYNPKKVGNLPTTKKKI